MNAEVLLQNIDKVYTTEIDIDRIWYYEIDDSKITINSYSYMIIIAHIIK